MLGSVVYLSVQPSDASFIISVLLVYFATLDNKINLFLLRLTLQIGRGVHFLITTGPYFVTLLKKSKQYILGGGNSMGRVGVMETINELYVCKLFGPFVELQRNMVGKMGVSWRGLTGGHLGLPFSSPPCSRLASCIGPDLKDKYFLNFSAHVNHLGVLLKCRFSSSGVRPKILHF